MKGVRVGIQVRVALLGVLGVLGLLLVGSLYWVGERSQRALQQEADASAWISSRFSRTLTDVVEARQQEAEFLFHPREVVAGQYALSVEAALADLADIERYPGGSESARRSAALLTRQVSDYTARFGEVVTQQRTLGLDDEDGLQGSWEASIQAAEWVLHSAGEHQLTALLIPVRRHEKDVLRGKRLQHKDDFNTRVAEFEMALQSPISLGATAQKLVATQVAVYQRDFLAYAQGRIDLAEATQAAEQAFEEALGSARAALGLADGRARSTQAQIVATREQTALRMRGAIAAVALVVAACALWFGHGISRPLARVVAATNRLAGGDDVTLIKDTERRDEVGDVARALTVFRRQMGDTRRLATKHEAERQSGEEQRRVALLTLADRLEAEIGSVADHVADAADRVRVGASDVVAATGATRRRAIGLNVASERSASSIQTVAAATEELTAVVEEISAEVARSTEATRCTATQAQETDDTVQALSGSATRVGDVMVLIAAVTSRTKLLALNARIEAARTGDAGRGFSVIADEIKALAQKTAAATDDIRGQIGAMQASTTRALVAVKEVTAQTVALDMTASGIAASVLQQRAVTLEIARNTQHVASIVDEMTSVVGDVHLDVERADGAAEHALAAADQVAVLAITLRRSLEQFLAGVRNAA